MGAASKPQQQQSSRQTRRRGSDGSVSDCCLDTLVECDDGIS
jgi:hypothetical protein